MSKAAIPAKATTIEAPAVRRGRKKPIIVAAVAALAVLGGGAAYSFLGKGDSVAQAPEGDGDEVREVKKKEDKRAPPVFLALDTFTVNLADRDTERYAQVGVTLELNDAKTTDILKVYMPAIRNDILMLLAHKKVAELQERAGKTELAREIRRAALKPLDADAPKGGASDSEADGALPVRAVHFSSFIIQ
jgi:flagellar FliL protein